MNRSLVALGAFVVAPLLGCATVHESVETSRTVVASRTLSRAKSPAPTGIEVRPRFLGDTLEVTVNAVSTCVEKVEDTVATDTITRRKASNRALGIEAAGVLVGAALITGAAIAASHDTSYSGECDTANGPACGAFPPEFLYFELGVVTAVTAGTILIVDLARQHDSTDRVGTEAVVRDASVPCDRGPARGATVELIAPTAATRTADENGVARFPFDPSYHGPVRLRIDGHDAPTITR